MTTEIVGSLTLDIFPKMSDVNHSPVIVPSPIESFHNFSGNTSNMTGMDHSCHPPKFPLPEVEQAMIILAYGLVSFMAVVGNFIVCFIVVSFKNMRRTENFFIFNLALADILMACLCIPFSFIPSLILASYPFGWVMCKLMNYSQGVTVFVASYTLVAISMERYYGIVHPFKAKMRRRKAIVVMCLTWVLALIVTLPTAIFAEVVDEIRVDGTAALHCTERWPDLSKSDGSSYLSYVYGMFLMSFQYFIPVGIMIFAYSTIAVHVWKMETPGEAMKDRDKKLKDEKLRMTKMMVVVVLLYIISWLPINVYNVIADQYSGIMYCYQYIHYIWFVCHWLAMSHATYNPIIYFWMNSKFRAGFIYVLNIIFRWRKLPHEWLVEHKLVGGYTLSTKRFSTVLNKHDSTSTAFTSQLSTRSGLGAKNSQASQEFQASIKKTGSGNRRNTEERYQNACGQRSPLKEARPLLASSASSNGTNSTSANGSSPEGAPRNT
ncbi:hypothetical protein RvY_11754 [Ramazzottius varieornatus]|uniref:G-protein coupled receptors family 1 profile domain-containing protein n=1 Tax=Ramazzottius varieornatus TaxID=947166 RepID=A0A1D1VH49_RAMVA|nr:hypothetical protein RvY_11754 [Ramazzottius varieornatus]